MISFLSLLLLTTHLLSPALAFFKCGNLHPARPDPEDCVSLLAILRKLPWTRIPVRYGRGQSYPGTTPLFISDSTCRFEIRANDEQAYTSDVFELQKYFVVLEYIMSECIKLKTGGYSMGTGSVGFGDRPSKFYAYLGAIPNPPESGMRNGTVLSLGGG